jgi:cation diffusion facilitator CzcD-associated flavoprotein CzcO
MTGISADDTATVAVDVAVVGSGFAGIGMGYNMKKAGIHDFVILDRAPEVGGIWSSNTYPGCQCDIPSHLYSFSFALNPDWSRTYPLQEEIRGYLGSCASRFGLVPHLRLDRDVQAVRWDAATTRWIIETSRETYTARVVVSAVGSFSERRFPDIPGRHSFEGESLHSAAWDVSVDVRGKHVAVIGTGASAIQIVPSIQSNVGGLHVFQRTAPWIMPHMDRPITRLERWIYRRIPVLQRVPRAFAYLFRECASPAFTRYPRLLAALELHARRHMKKQVRDPRLRRKLTPNYRIGCKRILPSNKWYPALQSDNVQLVTDGIDEITERGVRTSAGEEIDVDMIIYATGFEATDWPFAGLVVGKTGESLADVWGGSPQAYKNTTVPGFPNFFLVPGLQTGYTSQVFMIEAQLNYVIDSLRVMREGGDVFEVKDEPFRSWNSMLQRRMPRTVWISGGCASWYVDKNGLATTVWPDFTWRFRQLTRRFDQMAYEISVADERIAHPAELTGGHSWA